MTAHTVYLARHGRSDWNVAKRVTGQGDPALAAKGRRQAAALATVLDGVALDAIVTSPLGRAVDTAAPISIRHRRKITTIDAFSEISLGVLEGRYRDGRDPEAQRLWNVWQSDKDTAVPGGESFPELESRVRSVLQAVLDRWHGAVLIVGHRSTNRVILGALLGWPPDHYRSLPIRNRYVYRIDTASKTVTETIRLDRRPPAHRRPGFLI